MVGPNNIAMVFAPPLGLIPLPLQRWSKSLISMAGVDRFVATIKCFIDHFNFGYSNILN